MTARSGSTHFKRGSSLTLFHSLNDLELFWLTAYLPTQHIITKEKSASYCKIPIIEDGNIALLFFILTAVQNRSPIGAGRVLAGNENPRIFGLYGS